MLITLLNVAAVILIILGVCVLLGAIAIGTASGTTLVIVGVICAVVAYVLARGGRTV